ncbi:MAG: signal peptide peptidase SppA [Bacteroidota bacterium]|nr:signal peptide peptidase SppA [Bacteroidota bacterium]
MNGFFKYVFASMIGFIFGYIVIFFISILLVVGIVSFVSNKATKQFDKEVVIEKGSILKIKLNKPIQERVEDNPFSDVAFLSDEMNFPISLKDIIDNIAKAKDDEKIKGIYLNLTAIPARFATLEEIRNALIDFKESKKFIYAYSDILTEDAYYIASVADKIYLEPEGMLIFDGFHSEMAFMKAMFEKLEITPKLIRVGKYKSAGEPFIRDNMSDANRKQMEEFLFPLYDNFLKNIAQHRSLSTKRLKYLADNYKIGTSEDALKYKMVDGLIYYDEFEKLLKEKADVEELNFVRLSAYSKSDVKKKEKKEYTKEKIALIYASGSIGMGKGSDQNIGAESLSKAIRKARESEKIKAIVLRINSPGGAALASDIIWREVKLAAEKKPFVVSMGDLAASGGYYIACPADRIVAQPNTITGSIGVFGLFMNMKDFWNNKLGVTFDRVKTGKYSDMMNPNREMLPEEEAIIQNFVNNTYDDFVSRVAEGRNLPDSVVRNIAQGRIWSGEQALKNGLVDELGGLYDAIEIAAEMAELENYRLKILPDEKNPFEKIFGSFGMNVKDRFAKSVFKEDYKLYKKVQETREMNGVYMLMPYEFQAN